MYAHPGGWSEYDGVAWFVDVVMARIRIVEHYDDGDRVTEGEWPMVEETSCSTGKSCRYEKNAIVIDGICYKPIVVVNAAFAWLRYSGHEGWKLLTDDGLEIAKWDQVKAWIHELGLP